MKPLISILLCIFFIGCNRLDHAKLKYLDGYSIGDWIDFRTDVYSISNDTIFNKSKPVAVVIDDNCRTLDRVLTIRMINDTIRGYYINKGE